MGIEDGSIEYKLIREIEYSSNGQAAMANFVVLREPGMDQIKYYLRLKQMIMRAQMSLATKAAELSKLRDSVGDEVKPFHESTKEIEGDYEENATMIRMSIQSSDAVDMSDFVETFAEMACTRGRKSICVLNDQAPMTQALWAKLFPDDAFEMAVRWCAFFGMPSLEGVPTTSDQQ